MAQYKTGTVTVLNGSTRVLGQGTDFLAAGIKPGDMLLVSRPAGEDRQPWGYVAGNVSADGFDLVDAWAGSSFTATAYAIHRDFAPSSKAPIPRPGDINTDQIIARAVQVLDGQNVAAIVSSESVQKAETAASTAIEKADLAVQARDAAATSAAAAEQRAVAMKFEEGPGILAALVTASRLRTWIEANDQDGGPTEWAVQHIGRLMTVDVLTEAFKAALSGLVLGNGGIGFRSAPGILAALTDANGLLTDLVIDAETGQIPDWVIARWASRIEPLLQLPGPELKSAPGILAALTDAAGRLTDIVVEEDTGQVPDWVIARWASRLRPMLGLSQQAQLISSGDVYVRDNEVLPVLPDMARWAGWGSSSIDWMASYWTALAQDHGVTWYNGGKFGERGDQILARMGARPARLTVPGGIIPSSGAVGVTSSNMPPGGFLRPYTGTLAGVPGTLSSTDAALTFTREADGAEVPVPDDTPFIPDIGPTYRNAVSFLNIGKNSLNAGTSGEIVAQQNIDAFDWLSPLVKRCLILGQFVDGNTPAESASRASILQCNAILSARFGNNYIDIQNYVVSEQVWTDTGITPTAEDLEQQSLGNKPPSISADAAHFNDAGYTAIRDFLIAPRIAALGWYPAKD